MSGRFARRGLLIVAGVASLILLRGVLGDVYGSALPAAHVPLAWLLAALALEATTFASTWTVQRVALRAPGWWDVVVADAAANSVSNVAPAGSEVSAVVQLRMLHHRGYDLPRSMTALSATTLLSSLAALAVLPLLLVVGHADDSAVVGGGLVPLTVAALVGAPLVLAALRSRRAGRLIARSVTASLRRIGFRRQTDGLEARIVNEHAAVCGALRNRMWTVVVASFGRAIGDYLAFFACVLATGARPSPAVVLAAYVAGNAFGMLPITPGGIGFVEAGLSGTLVATGMSTSSALTAVAVYRLVSCWIPVVLGGALFAADRLRSTPAVSVVTQPVAELVEPAVVTADSGAIGRL